MTSEEEIPETARSCLISMTVGLCKHLTQAHIGLGATAHCFRRTYNWHGRSGKFNCTPFLDRGHSWQSYCYKYSVAASTGAVSAGAVGLDISAFLSERRASPGSIPRDSIWRYRAAHLPYKRLISLMRRTKSQKPRAQIKNVINNKSTNDAKHFTRSGATNAQIKQCT